jgi:hypothetical protein
MNDQKFMKVLSDAQKLMLDDEWNALVESKADSFVGRKPNKSTNNSYEDIVETKRNVQMISENESYEPIEEKIDILNDKRFDKLPREIRESFAKNPSPTAGQRDMSRLGVLSEKVANVSKPKNPVNEERYAPQNSGIDYSLIKTIIDESVKRNLSEMLGGGMLNENTLRGLKINKGNKIQLLDTAGNLYEATLVLKKKKN